MQDRRPEASLLMHLDWHPRTQINHETINRLLKCIDDNRIKQTNLSANKQPEENLPELHACHSGNKLRVHAQVV